MSSDNVIFIGMPSAGKSVLGKKLAADIGFSFLDTDTLLEQQLGFGLQTLVDRMGYEDFRHSEAQLITGLTASKSVIATGGSVIYSPEAMARLTHLGKIIFLYVPFRIMETRIAAAKPRGLAIPTHQSLEDLYQERLPLYERYANYTLDTSVHTPDVCVQHILDFLAG